MVTVLQHGPPLLGSVSIRAFPPPMPGVSSSVDTDVLAHYFCHSYSISVVSTSQPIQTTWKNLKPDAKTMPQSQPNLKTRAPFTKEGKCIIHLGTFTSKWPFKSLKAFLSISRDQRAEIPLFAATCAPGEAVSSVRSVFLWFRWISSRAECSQ